MKKFLKVFSVVALLCCCMFTFVGCDMFKDDETKNEYATLIAERKIVREVIGNTKEMLASNVESETQPLGQSAEVAAKSNEGVADEMILDINSGLQLTMTIVEGVMSETDFVPGKMYSFTLWEFYYVVNVYCSGDNIVTLNMYSNKQYDTDWSDTIYESMDIYYNEKLEVVKIIDNSKIVEIIESEDVVNEYCTITNIIFADNGETVSCNILSKDEDGEKNIQSVIDGTYREYQESDFTTEMHFEFDESMELLNARTSLASYARPLSSSAQNKLNELIENLFS